MSKAVSERGEGLAQAHTPAPWMAAAGPSSVVGWPVVAQQGQSICSLSWLGVKPDHVTEDRFAAYRAEVAANARLIAAAPDLLEACKLVMADLQSVDTDSAISLTPGRALRAAIAKAEGC